ncbi:ZPR1 zinc finger domain-containing protein [Nanoarchaeota archaeon]
MVEEILEGQPCPMCKGNSLALVQEEVEIPFFGKTFIFSMTCTNCKYHKSDIEAAEQKEPVKLSIDVESEEDLKIRIVKSAAATVKIPHLGSITPGPAANGYVTNIEGIFTRLKEQIENVKEADDDETNKKKAKNMLKKIGKILWGQEKSKLIIEDPTGNSAIISEKAQKSSLKA